MEGKIQDKRRGASPQPQSAGHEAIRDTFRFAPKDDMVLMRLSPLPMRRQKGKSFAEKTEEETPCCTPRELFVYSHLYL